LPQNSAWSYLRHTDFLMPPRPAPARQRQRFYYSTSRLSHNIIVHQRWIWKDVRTIGVSYSFLVASDMMMVDPRPVVYQHFAA
jgi:hypothetical protein